MAELWAPALGCQTPYAWKQLTTWLRAVTSELPAHPGSLAGSAPGRKPPRSALWTTCHSRGDPERWLESKGSGSGRAHKSSSCARWAGERWGRTSQEMEARAAGAALLGSRPANRIVSTTDGIEVDEKGYVKILERPFGMTTRRGVFAGGDVVHRPQTVVLAMKAAQEVAQGIEQYVDAVKLMQDIEKREEA